MPVELRIDGPDSAAAYHGLIQRAFGARPAIDPPAEALADTVDDIEVALGQHQGVAIYDGGALIGCLVLETAGEVATLRRVSVDPDRSRSGLASALVKGALELAADLGCTVVELIARAEFPDLVAWWQARGFEAVSHEGSNVLMRRDAPRILEVSTAQAMHELGRQLAQLLQPGDVIIATGELGAGKTTLTQGIGDGLNVEGPVISPTFVISRIHRALGTGPDLVHVDAYRMEDAAELSDIDLDTTLATSVTLVEWGEGKAEWLSPVRLEIRIEREAADDTRTVTLNGVGERWNGVLEKVAV